MCEENIYEYRKCFNHYHICNPFGDLIGGKCDTEEEAKEKCERLNNGESTDEVLGTLRENLVKELPWIADEIE